MKFVLLALLAASPVLAKAGADFKCEDPGNSSLSVELRFDESAGAGTLEVDEWSGYPPTSLFYGNLSPLPASPNFARFESEADRTEGDKAQLALPVDFLRGTGGFHAELKLQAQAGGGAATYALSCVRH